jgi:hypothetical protein
VIPFRLAEHNIIMARNLAVKDSLSQNADYILMIDSDMKPDCELDGKPFWDVAWEFMMERRLREEQERDAYEVDDDPDVDKKIFWMMPPATIAAPYCCGPPNELVNVFRYNAIHSGSPSPHWFMDKYDRELAAMMSGISEVAALGTGLILYDARVFEHCPKPWFDYEYGDPPMNTVKVTSEDVYQCRNASIAGCPQYCAWDCWSGHIKDKEVTKPRPHLAREIADRIATAIRAGVKPTLINMPEDYRRRMQIPANPVDATGVTG